ncbi:CPLN2 protein, partial [Vireo altiloquus]|nr:CPLN2 protein [Vireo altiloquus]
PGWLLSPPGRPYLDSILHKNRRRAFGECPPRPPARGPGGVPRAPHPPRGPGHVPGGSPGVPAPAVPAGIEATTLFWPAKPRASARPVLFQLHLWD